MSPHPIPARLIGMLFADPIRGPRSVDTCRLLRVTNGISRRLANDESSRQRRQSAVVPVKRTTGQDRTLQLNLQAAPLAGDSDTRLRDRAITQETPPRRPSLRAMCGTPRRTASGLLMSRLCATHSEKIRREGRADVKHLPHGKGGEWKVLKAPRLGNPDAHGNTLHGNECNTGATSKTERSRGECVRD
jgi:hypothetical protein